MSICEGSDGEEGAMEMRRLWGGGGDGEEEVMGGGGDGRRR